jgi:16S rRNA (uracil1498-N3)-methyltransferase
MRREHGNRAKNGLSRRRTVLEPDSMAAYDFRTPRLFVDATLAAGREVALDSAQRNYLLNVLRHKRGDPVLLFNGRDGEWQAQLSPAGKHTLTAEVGEQARVQPRPGDLHFLFAPLKHVRLDYLVQKAVEMGVSRLRPVITKHTQVTRLNLARMRANAIEAAQQCGILSVPEIAEPLAFGRLAASAGDGRLLIFCDEDAEVKDPVAALSAARPTGQALLPAQAAGAAMPLAVLIGPEGGFAEEERAALLKRPNVLRIALGPRVLRADTAAVAALAVVQTVLGDWREKA